MPCVPMPISPNRMAAIATLPAEFLALSTRVRLAATLKRDGTMATINAHQSKTGTKTYRVRVRRKGQPVQTASFPSLKDAKRWAVMIEGEIIAGRHCPNKKPKPTLNELLDRYIREIMPRKSP